VLQRIPYDFVSVYRFLNDAVISSVYAVSNGAVVSQAGRGMELS